MKVQVIHGTHKGRQGLVHQEHAYGLTVRLLRTTAGQREIMIDVKKEDLKYESSQ